MIERLRIEPISDYLERYRKAKSFPVSIANGFVFVSGLPPFDPNTGEIKPVAFELQAERVLAQLKRCPEAAGSSLGHVLKCNVYCTPEPSHFAKFNAVYDCYFAEQNPARIFLHAPLWPRPFDGIDQRHNMALANGDGLQGPDLRAVLETDSALDGKYVAGSHHDYFG